MTAEAINTQIKQGKLKLKNRLCLIIDGPTLEFALDNKLISSEFFKVCLLASSVICCRVSPK